MSDHTRLMARAVLSATETFPNKAAESRLSRLVGLDGYIQALVGELRLLFDPLLVRNWSVELYGHVIGAVELLDDTVPLIVFEGDVGTGKTALAETIGQRIASEGGYGVHLVKMKTRVRGTGYVGEMGTLLAESFEHVERVFEQKGEPVLFMIDEADSVLTSRASEQHHHEDKSGVNTILQHLDELKSNMSQVAVIAITNRIDVLDPAVLRRATRVFKFLRPNREQRAELLKGLFGDALSQPDVQLLIEASERCPAQDGTDVLPLSYADLTLRFAAPVVRRAAWCNERLCGRALAKNLRELVPSPSMSQV